MSTKKDLEQGQLEADEEHQSSSSLGFLNPGKQPVDEGELSNIQTKRKPQWQNQQMQVGRKVLITNRRKEKIQQNDAAYDGTYLYKPGVELPSLYHFSNQTIKIIVASEYLKKHNPQLLKRNIYGTQTYTSHSDAVCILVHSGYINLNTFPNKRVQGVQLTCKVIKPKKTYSGSLKNGLMSRNIKGYNGNALKPQSCKNLQSLGSMQMLQRYAANMHIPIGKNRIKSKPKNLAIVNPIPQTHIVFNMHNQPAYKYSLFNLADKGFQKNEFLIKKLDNMVLYLETEKREKFELVKRCQKQFFDIFKFSKILNAQKCDNEFMLKQKSPLGDEHLQKIDDTLEWQDIKWGNQSVWIKNRIFENLRSFKFYKKQKV